MDHIANVKDIDIKRPGICYLLQNVEATIPPKELLQNLIWISEGTLIQGD